MPRLSDYIDQWDTLTVADRQEFGRKLNAIDAKIAAWANQLNQAIGSIVIPVEVPTGGKFIGIFNTSCPSGWTRVTAFDGKFLRGAATYGGTGGSDTHTHTYTTVISHYHSGPSHTHGISSGGAHTHDYTRYSVVSSFVVGAGTNAWVGTSSQSTGSSGSHDHGGSTGAAGGGSTGTTGDASGTTAAGSTLPAYIEVVFCSKD